MSLITIGLGLALGGSKIQSMVRRDNSHILQLTNTLDLFSEIDSFNLAE